MRESTFVILGSPFPYGGGEGGGKALPPLLSSDPPSPRLTCSVVVRRDSLVLFPSIARYYKEGTYLEVLFAAEGERSLCGMLLNFANFVQSFNLDCNLAGCTMEKSLD